MEPTSPEQAAAPGQENLESPSPEQPSPKQTIPERKKDWRQAVRGRNENMIPRVGPQLATGVTIGCFAGTGYGLAIGVGTIVSGSRNTAIIVPSPRSQPFAHDGPMVGAFCGVVAGGGFATGIGAHLGYRWQVFDEWYQAATAVIIHSITRFSASVRTFFQNSQLKPRLRVQSATHIHTRRPQICTMFPSTLHR